MAELKIKADSGGGTVSFKGPATTTSNAAVQLTLPVDDGTANQYLKTDGSGALSWATVDTSIADDSLTEAKLDIHAAPSGTDKFLGYTSNGMEWAVPPDNGKILQVVQAARNDVYERKNVSSTSFVNIGYTVSITPIKSDSKIFVYQSLIAPGHSSDGRTYYTKIQSNGSDVSLDRVWVQEMYVTGWLNTSHWYQFAPGSTSQQVIVVWAKGSHSDRQLDFGWNSTANVPATGYESRNYNDLIAIEVGA